MATLINPQQTKNITREDSTLVCYVPPMLSNDGVWKGGNPFHFSLSLFIIQIVTVILATRAMMYILKPFRQPRVIAEITGGIILGPSVLGQIHKFPGLFFPLESLLTLETIANIGLIYFLFLVGVEMDIFVIRRMGRKALVIALAGMLIPFSIGIATTFLFRHHISHQDAREGPFLLLLGVALSITAFPVLARILAELKLLNTELGRISMTSAIINDMCAWILLAIAITLADNQNNTLSSLWVLLSGTAFTLICFYAVRPGVWWLIHRIPEGNGVSDFDICLILTGVMIAGFTTDAIGIHAVFGAFVFGLVIPNGPFGEILVDKLEDFVNGMLLPLFFVVSGLRTDVSTIRDPTTVGLLVVVFVLATLGKIAGTVLISMYYNMPFREGLSLGFLMSTRGLVEIIILNVGRDKQVLNDQSFAVMVLMSVLMTATVTPVVTTVHKPARLLISYKRRNLQRSKPDAELRMLVCIHTPRNVPSTISLLEISNPKKRSPIFVYALHLIELTGRASAMLVSHTAGSSKAGVPQSENIFLAFDNFEQRAGGVSVQPLSAVSPYSTMHEDICGLAADKHVSFILLPFHKHQTVDGVMEATNPAMRTVNEQVLTHAPCSVGILVDRGLGATTTVPNRNISPSQTQTNHLITHHIAALFFGGPDDREALAYAWRMADHPNISLAVIRFLSSPSTSPTPPQTSDPRVLTVTTSEDRERKLDEEYFSEFRLKNLSNESVVYMEKLVSSSEDTVAVIRTMDSVFDLYVVGRGQGEGAVAQLRAGLTEWSESPELGPIGDLLASSDFAATVSVMVVQQYTEGMPESPRRQNLGNGREHRGRGGVGVGAGGSAFNIG